MLPIRPSSSAWKHVQVLPGSSAKLVEPLSSHADRRLFRTISEFDRLGLAAAEPSKCTTDMSGLPLSGSEILAETVRQWKLRLSRPVTYLQCRRGGRSSSSQRLAPVPPIIPYIPVRAGCNSQLLRRVQRSKASAEWSPLVPGECARLPSAFPLLVFSH